MDPEFIPFGYEIAGCVNGAHAALRIEGAVAGGEVRFETKIACPEEPLLWDKTTLALAAIDPVILISLDPDAVRYDVAPEIFWVESSLFDDGAKIVGRFVLSGYWSVLEGRISIRAQVVEARLSFEPMEQLTHVGMSLPMSLLSAETGRVVATRIWAAETSRGNSYSGVSVLRVSSLAYAQEPRGSVLRLRWTEVPGVEARDGPAPCAYRLTVEDHAQR